LTQREVSDRKFVESAWRTVNTGSHLRGNAWGNALHNLAIILSGASLTEAATRITYTEEDRE